MNNELVLRLENLQQVFDNLGFYTKSNIAYEAKQYITELENKLVITKAAYDGLSSLLLSVQKDSIIANKQVQVLKAMLRTNILCSYPSMTHDEVENKINYTLYELVSSKDNE